MGYAKLGFRRIPVANYLPAYATVFMSGAKGERMEAMVFEAFKKMGNDGTRLKSIIPETILQIVTDDLPVGSDDRRMFLHIMAQTITKLGYMPMEIPIFEYRTKPVLTIDEACSQMTETRIAYPRAEDIGGEYATLSNLRAILPSVVRSYAYASNEQRQLINRLRRYIGHCGWKLMTGQALGAAEKTLFSLYCDTNEGSPGFSHLVESRPIQAIESKDPLDHEAFSLYTQFTELGNFFKFNKLKSDQNMERLTAWYGPLPSELTTFTGYMEPFGPFRRPVMQAIESIKWSADDQLIGIADSSDYVQRKMMTSGTMAIKPPRLIQTKDLKDVIEGVGHEYTAHDAPDIVFALSDEKDVSNYTWSHVSPWRRRVVDSASSPLSIEDYLVDVALQKADVGDTTFERTNLADTGIADFSHPSLKGAFVSLDTKRIMEKIYLPSGDGRKLEQRDVDMTDLYVRHGVIQTKSAMGDRIIPARDWFTTIDESAVNFVAQREGLSVDETVRFRSIISIAHNAARFERLTGREPQFDVKQYCANVGGYQA